MSDQKKSHIGDELALARLRWEWMRRKKDYQADFKTATLWRATRKKRDVKRADAIEAGSCKFWRIEPGPLPDPAKTWEVLSPSEMARFYQRSSAIRLSFAVAIGFSEAHDENAAGCLELVKGNFIVIDPSKAKSIKALKEEVNRAIDFHVLLHPELFNRNTKRRDAGQPREGWEDILLAGELKERGLRNKEIAKHLFPKDFEHPRLKEDKEAHRRSAESKAAQRVAEFEKIEFLTFP